MPTAAVIETADVIEAMMRHPAGDIDAELEHVFATVEAQGRTCADTCAPRTVDSLLCCVC
jgi:hypothetical protein